MLLIDILHSYLHVDFTLNFALAFAFVIQNVITIHPEIFTNEFPSRFFFVFCFVIFTGIRCGVDIAQKPNKSGQILDQRWQISFVIFTKLIPRRIFLCCKHCGVDGSSETNKSLRIIM